MKSLTQLVLVSLFVVTGCSGVANEVQRLARRDAGNGLSGAFNVTTCGDAGAPAEAEMDGGAIGLPEFAAFDGGPGSSPGFASGVDPGASTQCYGSAFSCNLFDDPKCGGVLGCSVVQRCSGFPTSCFELFSDSQCRMQRGCYWNTSAFGGECSGIATECAVVGAASCSLQQGCAAADSCTGSAIPCSALPTSECATQPGCFAQ